MRSFRRNKLKGRFADDGILIGTSEEGNIVIDARRKFKLFSSTIRIVMSGFNGRFATVWAHLID